MEKIEIYTDGSCYPNNGKGKGGWAFVVVVDGEEIHSQRGGGAPTTNNRMEITAILEAMEFCEQEIHHKNITIYTDSEYCRNGYHTWMHNWQNRDWMMVKNSDLWRKMFEYKDFTIEWVKGHSENRWNELADKMADYKINN